MSPMPERMSDHWWWRPGVRPGRRLLVWHILLHDQPAARRLVRDCQAKLAGIAGLDSVPAEWLHMTTQIVGFQDEIGETEVREMIGKVTEKLHALNPVTVEIGKPLFHAEAVMLGTRPPRALDPIRGGIRDAIADTVTMHQLDDEPDWVPHVSIAYSNGAGPAGPVIEAFRSRPEFQELVIGQVHLVAQERIERLYRWAEVTAVPLG